MNKGGVNITKCIIYETSSASGGIQLVRVKFKMKKIMNESPPSSPPPPRWRRKRKLSVDDDIATFLPLISVTRWPDGLLKFGRLQQRKHAQYHNKIAKVDSTFDRHKSSKSFAKVFSKMAKFRQIWSQSLIEV